MPAKGPRLSRRDLVKSFGLSAVLLHPVLRSMAYAGETPFARAPRYVMFFKGGAYYPARTKPASLTQLAGTPIAQDGEKVWTTPYDDTVLVMPGTHNLKPGGTAVRLGRFED